MPIKRTGKGVANELLLDGHRVEDDLLDGLLGKLVDDVVGVQHACEVAVHALVAADELVGETQAGHQAALLEPKDGTEAAREEDAFHGGKGHNALRKVAVVNPLKGPICFFLDAVQGFDGIEKLVLLCLVLDVGVDQQRVGLAVDVFHHDLEAVEKLGFCVLHFRYKVLGEVLIHNPV
jgi:hypothetical protein